MKKYLVLFLKFCFFLGLGVLLIWLAVKDIKEDEKENIKTALRQANYFWIILSILISGLSHYFRALRWKIALEPLGYTPKTSNAFFSVMVGYLANLALPRVGEVTRCGVLTRYEKIPFVQGFGTVLAERALDVVCVIILFFMTLGIEFSKIYGLADDMIFSNVSAKMHMLMQKKMFMIILALGLLGCVFLVLWFRKKIRALMSDKIRGFIKGLWEGLLSIRKVKRPGMFIVHTVLIWLMYILQVYVCFFAFSELSGLSFVVAMVITVFGSVAVAVVPGGTGMYQIIVVQILVTVYMLTKPASFAFAWAVWVSQIVLILGAGLLSLILLPALNKDKQTKDL